MLRRLGLHGALLVFLQLAIFIAAWPWPPKLEDIGGLILRRADPEPGKKGWIKRLINADPSLVSLATTSSSEKAKATTSPKAQASKTQQSASETGKGKGSKTTAAPASGSAAATSGGSSGKASSGARKTKATAAKTTKAPKSSAVDARLPAGGVNMLTPATTTTTFYKAGSNITFGWNYTSLSNQPHAIDVYVTCASNSATYTISNNMTFHSSAKVVWETEPEITGANPLLTGDYTLVIHDAGQDVTQIASAGNLGAYSGQSHFPIYTPMPYQNRTGKCFLEDA